MPVFTENITGTFVLLPGNYSPILSKQSGDWSGGSTWMGGVVPSAVDDVLIQTGHTVTISTTTATAASLTIDGVFFFSRSANATLTMLGSIVVRNGIWDQGRLTDRIPASVTDRLLFTTVEANFIGGDAMAVGNYPDNAATGKAVTDIGLWVLMTGQLYIHGAIKDTWTKLAATASGTSITVNGLYTQGWIAGDRIALTDTHLKTGDQTDEQSEVRTILTISGIPGDATRIITFSGALSFTHDYITRTWVDSFGDTRTEILAGEVINLSSNIIIDTTSGTNTNQYHIMTMEMGMFFVEDLRVANSSPVSKVNPMGRYAWHVHRQGDSSRGDYMHRTRFEGGRGGGLFNHESFGIDYQDVAFYNQATSPPSAGAQLTSVIFLENTDPPVLPFPNSAKDCRFDRMCIAKSGSQGGGFQQISAGAIWMGFGSDNCTFLGTVVSGSSHEAITGDFHWPEASSVVSETPHALKCETHSGNASGFFFHQNIDREGGPQIFNDWLGWRNGVFNMREGAYITSHRFFNPRMIGAGQAQAFHTVARRDVKNFLLDGDNVVGANGIEIGPYVVDSPSVNRDSQYADGVIQNIRSGSYDVYHGLGDSGTNPPGAVSWVQLTRVLFSQNSIHFGSDGANEPPPVASRIRLRSQTGLGAVTEFTLFHLTDTIPGAFVSQPYNALRLDSDTGGTVGLNPYIRITAPLDNSREPNLDGSGHRFVTLSATTRNTGLTDASWIEFFESRVSLGSFSPDANGVASTIYDMSTHPYRRAYFSANGRYNNSLTSSSGTNMSLINVVIRGLNTDETPFASFELIPIRRK